MRKSQQNAFRLSAVQAPLTALLRVWQPWVHFFTGHPSQPPAPFKALKEGSCNIAPPAASCGYYDLQGRVSDRDMSLVAPSLNPPAVPHPSPALCWAFACSHTQAKACAEQKGRVLLLSDMRCALQVPSPSGTNKACSEARRKANLNLADTDTSSQLSSNFPYREILLSHHLFQAEYIKFVRQNAAPSRMGSYFF